MLPSDRIEVRTAASLGSPSPGRLSGYAAVFEKPADLGEFTECVMPGAFRRTLVDADVLALYDHERRSILGRNKAGTLRLAEDAKGLAFDLDLPNTTLGRDLAVLVERGDVGGCSFGFRCATGGDRWSTRNGRMHRELVDVELFEITLTAWPAYRETEVVKRSLQFATRGDGYRSANIDLWLQTCR
jgi:uncharacterized protein